jgi:hypothetical protein
MTQSCYIGAVNRVSWPGFFWLTIRVRLSGTFLEAKPVEGIIVTELLGPSDKSGTPGGTAKTTVPTTQQPPKTADGIVIVNVKESVGGGKSGNEPPPAPKEKG